MSLGTFAAQNYQYPFDMIPGAACAYSIRQLSKNFTSAIMIVRRDSDNATTNLSFDTSGKISTSSPVSAGGNFGTWMSTANVYIQQWNDQSGNLNHVSQATTSLQPQLASAGVIISNGPLFLVSPSVQLLSLTALTQGTVNLPMTSFCAGQFSDSTLGNYYFCDSNNTTRYVCRFFNPGSTQVAQIGNGIGSTTLSINTNYVLSGFNQASGTTGSVYVNGVLDGTSTAANTSALNGIIVTHTHGHMLEQIHYPSTLSMTQFQAMNSNIRKYFSI